MISLAGDGWRVDGIAAVLFDKDGTLIDSHAYWGAIIRRRARAAVEAFGLPGDRYDGLCGSMGLDLATGRLRPEGPIALVSREEVIRAVRGHLATLGVDAAELALADLFVREHAAFLSEIHDHVRLLPGVRPLLDALRGAGVRTAVVTTDAVANTRETLRHLGIDGCFDAVIGKESAPEGKPAPGPALAALAALGASAGETACVGDAPMDLLMSRNAGLLACIGVATGQVPPEDLARHTPFVARSLEELAVIRHR